MEEKATGRARERRGELGEERPRGSATRETERNRGRREGPRSAGGGGEGGDPGLQGTKRAMEGRTERGARRIREEHYEGKRGRQRRMGRGSSCSQASQTTSPGGSGEIAHLSGCPAGSRVLIAASLSPLFWLLAVPGLDSQPPPQPPSPGKGRIVYLLLLLSPVPSSLSSRPDQAALSWKAGGGLHLPLITPIIPAFRPGRI